MIKHISSEKEFNDLIKNGDYLVDFYADWCGPCNMIAPILDEIGDNVNIIKVNVDLVSELAIKYGVMSIPTLIYFSGGNEKNKSVGFCTKDEILELIK